MFRLDYIPLNKKFRPTGIIKLREGHQGVSVVDIRPGFTSAMALPVEFLADCSNYCKPPLCVQFDSAFVASVKNGRIFAHDENNFAIITEDNLLIDDLSFQWVDSLVPANQNAVFYTKGFNKPRKYAGKVFSLLTLGAAREYYFHWMFDAIAKLELVKTGGLFDSIDYFLVPNYSYPFQKEYLSHLNIPEHKIINGSIEDHVQADTLLVSSNVRQDEHLPSWSCDFFYDNFVREVQPIKRRRRIYIARGDAARNRRVKNEGELINMLRNYGFDILYLTKIPIMDQIKIFNEAELIVAVHGGGLSNLVFCQAGTTLLEIFPDQYVRHYFHEICLKRGLAYHYVLCESEKPCDNHFDGELVNLTADIGAIQRKIDSLMRHV